MYFGEKINNLGAESTEITQAITSAVEAAMKAALPSIVAAVKDACIQAIKKEINPTLLITQYKQDSLDQQMRRENLRVTGLPEGGEEEETEKGLTKQVCTLAKEMGVEISPECISSCHRIGRKSQGGKTRQVMVRFTRRNQRDAMYDARFKLKRHDKYKGVFVNEDLTPIRHALLMRAKNLSNVKGASSKNGNIVCKMADNEFVTLRSPDDLFHVGCDDVKYTDFKLNIL